MVTEKISIKEMFINADPVVQIIMVLLFLASLVTWIIIFEKIYLFKLIKQRIKCLKGIVNSQNWREKYKDSPDLAFQILEAGLTESQDIAGQETRADYRERIERTMRSSLASILDSANSRVIFLATVGGSAPFIGLLGTVWGIMHSFIGIAASGETSLAVVAPGIAEALFATAMGLVAAIPAVIAYNKINSMAKTITKDSLLSIAIFGNKLAKEHFESKN